jgi:hypothetical protein
MPKVLIISYYAPPVGMSGVMRVTKLAKFLPRFDWQPIILTTKPIAYYHYDYGLLDDLKDTKIYRSESLDLARIMYILKVPRPAIKAGTGKPSLLSNFILFPDAKSPWIRFAYKLGCRIIETEKPDVIFASAPPFSAHLVGLKLKQKYNIPLIVDYRDPWPTGFVVPPNPHRKRLEKLRTEIIESADAVTAVNKICAEQIHYPQANIIENGFDPDDFQRPAYPLSGFNIVYTGMIWENIKELTLVADAVADLPEVKIILVGKADESSLLKLRKYKNIEYFGTRPHSETMSIMKGASLLLYLSKPNQIVGIKLYEYLGAGRPVLGICDECNDAMRLIENHYVGLNVSINKNEIRNAIQSVIKNKYPFNPIGIDHYNRINQTKKLSEIFTSLIK